MSDSIINKAYLLTGGNRGDRESYLQAAREAIEQQCGTLTAASPVYETEAWGLAGEPYLNQALELHTTLPAQQLLRQLLEIERALGRVRQERYGPRTIDIDILLFNNSVIQEPGLTVPHAQLPHRRFALQCLAHVAGGVQHPVMQKTVRQLLQDCPDPLWAKIYAPEKI